MIDEKRSSLEGFIREQTLGPGVLRARFVDKNDPSMISSNGQPYYGSELINTIPAGVYSTAILFPEDHTKGAHTTEQGTEQDKPFTEQPANDNIPSPIDSDAIEEEVEEEEEHVNIDSQSLNQMYPNAMGLTVCLDPKVIHDQDLEIMVSGRYYMKEQLKGTHPNIGVHLEQEREVFQAFLDQLPVDDVIKRSIGIGSLDDRSNYVFLHPVDVSTTELKRRGYKLKEEKGIQFPFKDGRSTTSLDTIKQTLFEQLRYKVLPETQEGREMAEKIRQIEIFENSLSHVLDLISIYDSSSYGLWRCESFHVRVGQDLKIPEEVKGKRVYSYKKYNSLDNVFRKEYADTKEKYAALSVNLQYSKFAYQQQKHDGLFLKVQLKNSSTPFTEKDTRNGKNYFSMASEEVNSRCFFGVNVEVRSKHLVPYRCFEAIKKDVYNEDEINRYIYRQYQDLGIGHGCSVKWGEHDGTKFVSTEYIPEKETPDVDPIPRHRSQFTVKTQDGYMPAPVFEDSQFLQFKWLSTLSSASNEAIISGMRAFVQAYGTWIEQQHDDGHPAIAQQIRRACEEDQKRMKKNVELLLSNEEVLLCFRLMNTAMFIQLWHSVKAKGDVVSKIIEETDFEGFIGSFYKDRAADDLFPGVAHAAWRPFQLAFILLNLDGIYQRTDDPQWEARNEWVDLVWFPTGGGKTEAYLGLIALTIIHRRRAYGEMGGGTAVMMRYTLRLLTTQQFQRATLLIMALELMRRWGDHNLGVEPIYIGLYVGASSLPNKLAELKEDLNKLKAAQLNGKTRRTKLPIQKCPWCGHELSPIDPRDGKGAYFDQRVLVECCRQDRLCAFSTQHPLPSRKDQGPIPISLCDEEIYLHPPALLFGTVDKFAQLAHKVSNKAEKRIGDSRRLFGKGNWETPKPRNGYRHPDLIIQDELHLMMGPLGSAVALFESAIDQLCTREGNGQRVRPKVISSTATTRNTALQIMALFDRKVNLFPKPGVHCDDSFFAFYKRTADNEQGSGMCYKAKRKYLGILPTGRTQMWMQLRLAAILFTHRAIFEKDHLHPAGPFEPSTYPVRLKEAMNYYHTVLAYFNSLREVGKTQSQVYSYLVKEIRRVFNNVIRPGMAVHCFYTYENCFHDSELTGRLSGEEVVSNLARISKDWCPIERLAHETGRATTPPDLVIATNMISVGIDVSRFNTMIINCMPRNIAEYIQASSRVARDKSGLVITVHHPFRSRDLSHYERFIEFHEKMYSYVEPISITPFTLKALQRYLPLYIATMIRHQGFPERTSADTELDNYEIQMWIKRLVGYFERRKEHLWGMDGVEELIKRLLQDENVDHITRLVEESLREWQRQYELAHGEGDALVFNNRADKRAERQLYIDIDEYQDNISSDSWRIPQSLRVVEPEAVIHIKQK